MAAEREQYDIVCVHCRKAFCSEVLAPNTEQAGFKCPHCRLYMPLERAAPDESAGTADAAASA
jgi:DNA-directed RNA polymerase subunit RPC12/RpoP